MNILEYEIEDIIYESSQTEEGRNMLCERGLFVRRPLKRQVQVGGYGVLDLIEVFPIQHLHVTIYELKKGSIDKSALLQLSRYMTGVSRWFNENLPKAFDDFVVRGVLIGSHLRTDNDFVFLLNQLSNISTYTFNISLDKGLVFEDQSRGWYHSKSDYTDLSGLLTGLYSHNDLDLAEEIILNENNQEVRKDA